MHQTSIAAYSYGLPYRVFCPLRYAANRRIDEAAEDASH
jgi:hypothetical protein